MKAKTSDTKSPQGYTAGEPTQEFQMVEDDDGPKLDFVYSHRPRAPCSIILAMNGSNYVPWKTVIPSVLDGEPYAWDVVEGRLFPPLPDQQDENAKKQRQNYINGNRAARYILMNSIHPDLAVRLFMDNGGTVEAHEIWRLIKDRFEKADGTKKGLALSKFTNYRWQNNLSAEQNCVVYKKIICVLIEAGINMQDDVSCARLLEALPSSWEPYRQACTGRDVEHQQIETLIELIETNAL